MDIEKISKVVGIFSVVAPIVWGGFTYSKNLIEQRKVFEFNHYHDVLTRLYDGGDKSYAGSQRALIFELSNFPLYKEFTCREFPRMKMQFKKLETLEEIELAYKRMGCKDA